MPVRTGKLRESPAAALLVVQANTSETTPDWPNASSNASWAPLGQDLAPVFEEVVALSATLGKPDLLA